MIRPNHLVRALAAVCLSLLVSGCIVEPAWGPHWHPHHWDR